MDEVDEVDEKRIYDFYIAGRQSAALAAAVHLELFDLVERDAPSEAELARSVGLRERPLRLLVSALIAMDLLRRQGDRLVTSDDASAYLVRGKPGWLGGLIELEVEAFLCPELLLRALRGDRASVYEGEDPWRRHARDSAAARDFTRAMHSISALPADGLARALDLEAVRSVLDVGGGSGALALALARAAPSLRAEIWDLPTVCEVADEIVREAGLGARVSTRSGDIFRDPFPAGHDAVLLSQILHDWSPETCRVLLERCLEALPPGGQIWIHEKLVDDDGRGPLANALVNLDMLVWTEGQQWSEAGLRELLASAGFAAIERRDTHGYWSVTIARKPAAP